LAKLKSREVIDRRGADRPI